MHVLTLFFFLTQAVALADAIEQGQPTAAAGVVEAELAELFPEIRWDYRLPSEPTVSAQQRDGIREWLVQYLPPTNKSL